MFIRKDITFLFLHLTTNLNTLDIKIHVNRPLKIYSIYLSPSRVITLQQFDDHWRDITTKRNSRVLIQVIKHDLRVLSEPPPTHYHQQTGTVFIIDFYALKTCLLTYFGGFFSDLCGNYHYPVIVHLLPVAPQSFRPCLEFRHSCLKFLFQLRNMCRYPDPDTHELL